MPLKSFKYTKQPSGDESYRTVYPMHLVDDKLLCIDLSDMDDGERHEANITLDAIHKRYIQMIKDAGFSSQFRTFFLEQMS